MVVSPGSRPSPWQVEQGSRTTRPSPPHVGHVVILTNCPNIERETCRSSPVPSHCGHAELPVPVFAPDPLQASHFFCFFTLIFFSTPVAISSSVSASLTFRSAPGVPWCVRPPRLPRPVPPN